MNIGALIFGNICSLLAMGTDSLSASRKTAKDMLWVQNASQFLYFIGTMALQGYSGAVQNAVCIIRNLVVIKGINSKVLEWIFLALGVILGICFNNIGFMGLLPIIANLQYTLVMFRFRNNNRALKISFLINAVLFSCFSLAIWNFVGVFTNLVVAITTAIFLVKSKTPPQK